MLDSRERERLVEKREWYSPSEIEMIYGFSRRTLGRILKEAEAQGRPVKVYRLKLGASEKCSRKRPCVRICRKSLDEYLEARSREGEKS